MKSSGLAGSLAGEGSQSLTLTETFAASQQSLLLLKVMYATMLRGGPHLTQVYPPAKHTRRQV